MPDSIGNRAYLEPGRNALVPQPDPEALLGAVLQLDDTGLAPRLAEAGRATARRFGLDEERVRRECAFFYDTFLPPLESTRPAAEPEAQRPVA